MMAFHTEPPYYMKTALSDLQGAWENLRDAVVQTHPFPESDRLLFHIDEGMSWENVRNLENMRKALLLIRNMAAQSEVPDDVSEGVENVPSHLLPRSPTPFHLVRSYLFLDLGPVGMFCRLSSALRWDFCSLLVTRLAEVYTRSAKEW